MKDLVAAMNGVPSNGSNGIPMQPKKSPLEGGLLGALNKVGGFLGEASGAGSFGRVTSEFGKDVVQGAQGLQQGRIVGEGLTPQRTKRVVGEGLQAASGVATASGLGLGGGALSNALKTGGLVGAGATGEELVKDRPILESLETGAKKGVIAAVASFAISKGLEKLAARPEKLSTKAGDLNTEAMKAPGKFGKELASDIQNGEETLYQRMAEAGYKGNPRDIVRQAETVRDTMNDEIGKALTAPQYANEAISRQQISMDVAREIQKARGNLTEAELSKLKKELFRLNPSYDLQSANYLKSDYAGRVNWDADVNSTEGLVSQIYRAISNSIRSRENDIVQGLDKLNESWALANDVSKLSSMRAVASAQAQKGIGRRLGGGLFSLGSSFARDYRNVNRLTSKSSSLADKAARSKLGQDAIEGISNVIGQNTQGLGQTLTRLLGK